MSYHYAYKPRDIKFIIKEWLPIDQLLSCDKFSGYLSQEDVNAIIDQVDKIAKEVVAPTADHVGNPHPRFENGKVVFPDSIKNLHQYLVVNGWGCTNSEEEAKGTLPLTLMAAVAEMFSAANPAFETMFMLENAAASTLEAFGDETIKRMILPKIYDGSWSTTMCITEPGAGSDVGDILSKARPTEDPHIYKLTGNKIFITGGDGDHVENIVHLFLARIEGAAKGTKGLSLFVAPKYWLDNDGNLEPNDVETLGIEEKIGIRGSATVSLAFGANGECRGWLLGSYDAESGEAQGMKQMFRMMNEMRLTVGAAATGIASNAYWNTVKYCKERIQGRMISNPKAGRVQIIQHEDVKRMLLLNKATLEACRAIFMKTAFNIDMSRRHADADIRTRAAGLVSCLTPLAKAYPSDEAWPLICECIQAHGGYGLCSEYPVGQAAVDVKADSIVEGTNFIQSMDLVRRKWTMDRGNTFAWLLKSMEDFIDFNRDAGFEREFANLKRALSAYREIQIEMARYAEAGQIGMVPTFSRRILTVTAQLFGGYCLMEQALIAQKRLEKIGAETSDHNFYKGKVLSARFYLRNIVPEVWALLEIIQDGDTSVMDSYAEIFEY